MDIDGDGAPAVAVHKGTASCAVHVPQDAPMLDITYTNGTNKVSSAEAQAYAVKLGKICADIFAGYGS